MPQLTARHVTYRLWRLRRLIGVAILLPVPGMLVAELFGRGLELTGAGGILLALWILAVLALSVRFPNGWTDVLALALPLAAIALLSPFASLLGVGPVGGVLLGTLALLIGWYRLNTWLPIRLDAVPAGLRRNDFRRRVRLPAAALRDALFLAPDKDCGLHRCGPANEDGMFEVTAIGYRMLGDELEPEESHISFLARIAEAGDDRQVTQIFTGGHDTTGSAYTQSLRSVRGGTVYEKEEVHDHFSLFSLAGFWLNDVEADHFTATLDHIRGAEPRALKLMDQDTLVTWLAQRLMQRLAREA